MENQNGEYDILEINKHSKRSLFKILKTTAMFFVIAVVFLFLAWFGLSKYGEWRFNKDLQVLKMEQDKPYLEDAYGGKTPKETLDLFIAAVEKEDFELASKYFVISKQEEWKEKLMNGEKQKLSNWINLLKKAQDKGSLWEGNFQMEVKNIGASANLVIDFIRYPQGNWKIQEI